MRRPRRLKNEINVVPYIDVMLVLLVIFMVATPMMQTGSVDLPSADKANTLPDKLFRVEVSASGEFTVASENEAARPVSREELVHRLEAAYAQNPDLAVLVAGDKNVRYETVLQTLTEVKSLGFDKVGLEVSRR